MGQKNDLRLQGFKVTTKVEYMPILPFFAEVFTHFVDRTVYCPMDNTHEVRTGPQNMTITLT